MALEISEVLRRDHSVFEKTAKENVKNSSIIQVQTKDIKRNRQYFAVRVGDKSEHICSSGQLCVVLICIRGWE